MSQVRIAKLKRILFNETGQMSIFVALIFQVLFVFFAMVVNIGLVVHDKINLQNAVDLGAYYAAQKQAEILNEIAHINYQLRQDYKLLTWRYRVVGTLGRQGTGNPSVQQLMPARRPLTVPLEEKEFIHPSYVLPDGTAEAPSVCVANDLWSEFIADSSQLENYCYRAYNQAIPEIPEVKIIAPFVPLVGVASAFSIRARQMAQMAWQEAGPLNWAYTMQMMYAYKMSIATRKSMILELRKNLVSADFKDQRLESVKTGVFKTIQKNLTAANLASFNENSFEMVNGLAHPGCSEGEGGAGSGANTIAEIRTAPLLFFTLMRAGGTSDMRPHTDWTEMSEGDMNFWDPDQLMRTLARGEPETPTDPLHSTLGYEKNPWCMAYVGVKATTTVRKPFSPMGIPITLKARAFAQPFGGRVGPWYKSRWPRSSMTSSAGDRVDPLTSPRLLEGGVLDTDNALHRLPNYSRFPGDTLGMKSEVALGATRPAFVHYQSQPRNARLSLSYYGASLDRIPEHGDPLAWDPNGPEDQESEPVKRLRNAEVAAVAPDLFDTTYYSIEPEYFANYARLNSEKDRFPNLPQLFGHKLFPPGDIGSRREIPGLAQRNIEWQIMNSMGENSGFDRNLLQGPIFWPIRTWEHLLTGWAPNASQDFSFPESRFGKCDRTAIPTVMIPGKCAAGGRVGYSVRLVSLDHLRGVWNIGGEGESPAPILNPPSPEF